MNIYNHRNRQYRNKGNKQRSMDERQMDVSNKKGYLKIHVAVNVKTKKILSMKVTDEHVHDSKALPGLIENIIKSDSMTTTTTTVKPSADGVYEGKETLRIWEIMESLPYIKKEKEGESWMEKRKIRRNLSVLYK